MRGDFTRDSFNPAKAYTRVLMQQGRVQLDADWNEQTSIFWHYLRAVMRDLLGPHAGPDDNCGFAILLASGIEKPGIPDDEQRRLRAMLKDSADFLISPGVYYVDGWRVTNHDYVAYSHQSHMQRAEPPRSTKAAHLIYLDLWEHEVSALQDAAIREIGLNGLDTASRARMVWQVRSHELSSGVTAENTAAEAETASKDWPSFTEIWQSKHRGELRVRTVPPAESDSLEPSTIAPDSAYRGPQNQLYRIEIHHSGTAKDAATFKWSRENASVIFAIESFNDPVLTVKGLGRDGRSTLAPGDWVEISDDDSVFEHRVQALRQVESVDHQRNQVTLQGKGPSNIGSHLNRHPVLTRWDQKAGDPKRGGLELKEGCALIKEGISTWIKLENGIQVQFQSSDPAQRYRAGDYWLIPARTASGTVEWPTRDGEPLALSPHGIDHHYAPLAILTYDGNTVSMPNQLLKSFPIPTVFAQ